MYPLNLKNCNNNVFGQAKTVHKIGQAAKTVHKSKHQLYPSNLKKTVIIMYILGKAMSTAHKSKLHLYQPKLILCMFVCVGQRIMIYLNKNVNCIIITDMQQLPGNCWGCGKIK